LGCCLSVRVTRDRSTTPPTNGSKLITSQQQHNSKQKQHTTTTTTHDRGAEEATAAAMPTFSDVSNYNSEENRDRSCGHSYLICIIMLVIDEERVK